MRRKVSEVPVYRCLCLPVYLLSLCLYLRGSLFICMIVVYVQLLMQRGVALGVGLTGIWTRIATGNGGEIPGPPRQAQSANIPFELCLYSHI